MFGPQTSTYQNISKLLAHSFKFHELAEVPVYAIPPPEQLCRYGRPGCFITTEKKKMKIPYIDFKMKIDKYILQQRQQCWNNNEKNNY